MARETAKVEIGATLAQGFTSVFQQAEQRVGKLGDSLAKLKQSRQAVMQIKNLEKTLGTAKEEFKVAKNELRKLERQQLKTGDASVQLKEQIKQARAQFKSTKKTVDSLNMEYKEAKRTARSLGVNTGKLAGEHNRLSRAINKTKKQQDAYNASMRRTNKLQSVSGKLASAGAGLATAGAVGVAASAAVLAPGIQLGKTLSTVQAAAGDATAATMGNLRDLAIEIGSSTEFTATQASSAMLALTKAGLTTNEVMASVKDTMSFATAGGIELGVAAEVTADALNQFSLEASDAGRIADVFSLAANKSSIDVSHLVESMKFLGPTAASVGASVEEASAFVGVLGNQGFKGGIATRAFASSLTRLAKPTNEIKEALSSLNIEAFDGQGKFLGLTTLFKKLEKQLAGASDQTKLSKLASVFGTAASRQALAILNAGTDQLDEFREALDNAEGSAAKFAAVKLDNMAGDITFFTSALGGFFVRLQQNSEFILRPIIQGLTSVLGGVNAVVDRFPVLSGALMAVVTVGSVLAIGLGGVALAASGLAAAAASLSGIMLPALGVGIEALTTVAGRNIIATKLMGAGFVTMGTTAKIGAVGTRILTIASRGLGFALRFVAGPIGWIILGVEALALAFSAAQPFLSAFMDGFGDSDLAKEAKKDREELAKLNGTAAEGEDKFKGWVQAGKDLRDTIISLGNALAEAPIIGMFYESTKEKLKKARTRKGIEQVVSNQGGSLKGPGITDEASANFAKAITDDSSFSKAFPGAKSDSVKFSSSPIVLNNNLTINGAGDMDEEKVQRLTAEQLQSLFNDLAKKGVATTTE